MSPDQARTAAALADLLQAEAALFDELSDLSGMQRRALARAAEAELAQAASRAETLATRFRLLEEERGRIESFVPEGERRVAEARAALARALGRLLRETAVSGAVLERLGDTVAARQAAVGGLLASTYRPDGRGASRRPAGARLSAEG